MKGNCIDKFIEKRLDIRLEDINNIRESIISRISERSDINDYFNTGCYESDFSDIIKIKKITETLLSDCNKFLERISEQYSKLN